MEIQARIKPLLKELVNGICNILQADSDAVVAQNSDILDLPAQRISEELELYLAGRIGMLRQWLNEDRIKDADRFITNEDIKLWLYGLPSPENKEA